MTSAEFRVRLYGLGLSVYDLASLTGWARTGLARQAAGVEAVSKRTSDKISELEELAEAESTALAQRIARGEAISVQPPRGPHTRSDTKSALPPEWHYARLRRALYLVPPGAIPRISYPTPQD